MAGPSAQSNEPCLEQVRPAHAVQGLGGIEPEESTSHKCPNMDSSVVALPQNDKPLLTQSTDSRVTTDTSIHVPKTEIYLNTLTRNETIIHPKIPISESRC